MTTVNVTNNPTRVTVSLSGVQGPRGYGVPIGGDTGQVLAKIDGANFNTEWVDPSGGGGGAVDSVNGQTGVVVLAAGDVGADPAGSASTAQAAAIATAASDATTKANAAAAASDPAGAATAAVATHVGGADPHTQYLKEADASAVATSGAYTDLTGKPTLGTAAAANTGDFDAAGAASTAQAAAVATASSDATTKANAAQSAAIAAAATDATTKANAAQAAAIAASQPLDSDLTAIAALTTTSYGRALLALADAAALRTTGNAAISTITQGKHAVPIMAGAISPSKVGGCAAIASVASGTNMPDMWTLDFDASTEEYAQFAIPMPKSWNEGTLTAQFRWSHAATTTNFGVVFGIQAVAVSDDDTIGVAYGTAQVVTDTGGTTNDLYLTSETPAITVAGSPATADTVYFRVYRKAADASDTMAIDARLHSVVVFLTTDADTDA